MAVDPASLYIHLYPAPELRQKAAPVPRITAEVRAVAARMIQLMYQAEGIGLAAPQVGLPWRMFVVDVPPTAEGAGERGEGGAPGEVRSAETNPASATAGARVYINPVLSKPTGASVAREEGCLSLPEIRGDVVRPPVVTIAATDLEGRQFTQTATGLLARCWQHEMDHLDGVLIIDKFTQMSRIKNRGAVRELEKRGGVKG